ncbi:MAG: hypothetical protein ACYTG6_11580 [Planctomycetota bacterium]|jgi:hypothetical protein
MVRLPLSAFAVPVGTLLVWSLQFAGPALAGEPPAENKTAPDHAPTPFSAEQIREGCPPGRRSTFLMEPTGVPKFHLTFHFAAGDEEGTDLETIRKTFQGESMGPPRKVRSTWKELQGHASFPAEHTVITEERIEVPAGAYDCWRYVVTHPDNPQTDVRTYWFAKSLPGPPIRLIREVDGETVMTMTLVEHQVVPPADAPSEDTDEEGSEDDDG